MNRNDLIVIVLAVLLVLAWPTMILPHLPAGFQPKPRTPQKEFSTPTPAGTADAPAPAANSVTSSAIAEQMPKPESTAAKVLPANLPVVEPRTLEIKTDLLVVRLNNKGGIIEHLALRQFHPEIHSQEPLVLIREPAFTSFNDPFYMQTEVHEAGGVHTVIFTGAGVRKTYTFKEGSYFFNYEFQDTTAVSNRALSLGAMEVAAVGLLGGRMHGAFYSTKGSEENHVVHPPEALFEQPIHAKIDAGNLDYAGFRNKYFTCLVEPVGQTFAQTIDITGSQDHKNSALHIKVDPGVVAGFQVYTGPVDKPHLLDADPKKFSPLFDYYGMDVIIHFLLYLLDLFSKIPGVNMGFAIILLTLAVRIVMFPLNLKAQTSMFMMAKLNPEVKKLQEQYKNDRQQLGMAQMKLFRDNGVNPLAGCLPMLIQMPVMLSLFTTIGDGFILRHEPFLLWIQDVSMPDRFHTFGFAIPLLDGFVGNGNGTTNVNLLVLFYIVTMFIQQSMMPKSTDPQQQQMQKMMKFMMLGFAILLYNYSSGLMIYFVGSNLLSMAESWYIKERVLPKLEARREKKRAAKFA